MDLSHPMDANLPRVPFFPEPRFERFFSIPEHILNVTRMDMVVHMGTHVDSPRHFFEDGPAFEDVPLDRLSGQGLVWRVDLSPGEDIEPRHLEECAHLLRADDILLLNTGSHLNVGTASYDDHPALTVDAARWIVEHDVKLLGVDTPTPDTAVKRREKGFDYPVHRLLLSHGVLILEHLTNLGALNGRRVELICAALNIVGGDGAPARVVGRALEK
jgi:kynurenine formamidase